MICPDHDRSSDFDAAKLPANKSMSANGPNEGKTGDGDRVPGGDEKRGIVRAMRGIKGAEAKALKQQINGVWIYPPRADRAEIFAAADPANLVVA